MTANYSASRGAGVAAFDHRALPEATGAGRELGGLGYQDELARQLAEAAIMGAIVPMWASERLTRS